MSTPACFNHCPHLIVSKALHLYHTEYQRHANICNNARQTKTATITKEQNKTTTNSNNNK
eukprot:2265946-Amphidinium_carterae.1